VSVDTEQSLGGAALRFCAWSHGAAASHTLTTPTTDQIYRAIFAPASEPCPVVVPALSRLFFPMVRTPQ
jgi:hypothetical protein